MPGALRGRQWSHALQPLKTRGVESTFVVFNDLRLILTLNALWLYSAATAKNQPTPDKNQVGGKLEEIHIKLV
jgi:hypothetical protein